MLEEVLRYLNNWFVYPGGIHLDTYTVQDGSIALSFLQENQYFRIIGSVFNDGVYQYTDDLTLTDETFDGAVWALAIPKAVIDIAGEIEDWQAKNGSAATGLYTSESFGGYSYTKASGSSSSTSGNAAFTTWQNAFAGRLGRWKKIGGQLDARS